MKRKLKLSEHETLGLLHYFWYWALEFAPTGDLTNLSNDDIADGCRYLGDPDEFMDALISSGFVDEVDGNRTIHDWFKHGGKLVVWREKEKARSKANRDKISKNVVNTESVQRTNEVRTEDVHPYVRTSNSNSKSNKEIKDKKEYADYVFLTETEHDKLTKLLGEEERENYFIRFASWISGQTERVQKKRSAYLTILDWHKKDKSRNVVPLIQKRTEPQYGVKELTQEELELMPRG
jgi:hypothetical protein